MTAEASDTIQCVHCGGTIRAAAKICKHCTRAVGETGAATASVPAFGATAAVPGLGATPAAVSAVLVELRTFLVQRSIAQRSALDPIFASLGAVDAGVALGHVAAAGHITPTQAESLRQAFWQQQGTKARGVVDAAVQRGLLTSAQADEAVRGYDSVALQQTVGEFLVAGRLLTNAQATELAGVGAGLSMDGLKARWSALPAKTKKIVIGVAAAVVLLPIASAVIGSADIEDGGTMNGYGIGTETFTNRGRRAGSVCGQVAVVCGRGVRRSQRFCSGNVEPRETKSVPYTVVGIDEIRDFRIDEWTRDCNHVFDREE